MRKGIKTLMLLSLLWWVADTSLAQNHLRLNAGYLIPSGEYADKSFEENSGMAGDGYGYSLDYLHTYPSGMGWSLLAGHHTNPMVFGNLEALAEDEFGGEWSISGDPWSYYFLMPGFSYRISWFMDIGVSLSAGYVYSISPEIRMDYTISETSDKISLAESASDAPAVMPSIRFAYPAQRWEVFLRWSAFLARPQFKVTLLDGEKYDVKQYIINMNLGLGVGYRF